jgi:hypothetical protein
MADIVDRLRADAEDYYKTDGSWMKSWDRWRSMHASGYGGTSTREEYESLLEHVADHNVEAADEIERLRVLVEGETPWHPIETAPKDGTEIDIKGDAGPYGVTSWTGRGYWGLPVNWHRKDSTWLTGKDGAVLRLAGYRPTHWRPICAGCCKPVVERACNSAVSSTDGYQESSGENP